jgi:hypothetical protein
MPTAPQSDSAPTSASRPSPIDDGFALSGVSSLPDPATHAYRKDLADTALAGRVIASHYAEPLTRHLVAAADLRAQAADDSEVIVALAKGDALRMLDNSRGWAWGYGPDGRVGYVPSAAVGA